MGCIDPPLEGWSAHPISVLSGSVASSLCYLMLTCTHSNDATHSSRYACDERNNWFEQTGQGHLIEDRYSTPPPTWKYDKYKLLDDKCLNSYSEGDVESTWITVVGTAKDEQFDMLIVVHAVCVLGLGMLPFVRSGPSAEKKKSE